MSTNIEKKKPTELTIEIPDGIETKYSEGELEMKGPLGEVKKDFTKIMANIIVNNKLIKISSFSLRKKHLSAMNTARSLIRNMIKGITDGYTYKLKIAFAHFPITVKVKENEIHIENFYGERSPRVAKIIGNSMVEISEEDVIINGISIEDVSQTAANVEQVTKVKNKDQRIFLDGVYIYEKRRKD
jgi:large subunit ribosomal protein L6